MVANGELGKIRKVYVEYPQGWLASDVEIKVISRQRGVPIQTDREKQGAWEI